MPAFSRYLFDKRLSLEPCVVTDYDEATQTYRIEWVVPGTERRPRSGDGHCCNALCALNQCLTDYDGADADGTRYEETVVPAGVSLKRVKRLNLLF